LLLESHCDFPPFIGPANPEAGTYKDRLPQAIGGYVRDKIRKPLMKFNNALKKVTDCDPTGCDEQAILNMAFAILMGKQIEWITNFERMTRQPTGTFMDRR
jgi:hypothetical protein